MSETPQCAGQKESPVYQQLRVIEDRLSELNQVNDTLDGRLSNILSEQSPVNPETAEPAKPSITSALEETLHKIRTRIETEISRQQNITNRLTI